MDDVTYLEDIPVILHEVPEYRALHTVFTDMFSGAWDGVNEIFANQFLDTLTDVGCSHWEKILKISPLPGATAEDRRNEITVALTSYQPRTFRLLLERLATYLGADGFTAYQDFNAYTLTVIIYLLNSQTQADMVVKTLLSMRPANIVLDVRSEKEEVQDVFAGHAVKSERSLYTIPDTYDPLQNHSWYVDEDYEAYIDQDGNVLEAEL